MTAAGERTSEFKRLRPYLLRVAYSHLGSLGEAEDVVQETWLRLGRAQRPEIRDLRAWLTTVVARLALDALASARARREQYVGAWLPEPFVAAEEDADLADRVTLDESVSMALLVVLESLTPAERSPSSSMMFSATRSSRLPASSAEARKRPASSPRAPAATSRPAGRATPPRPHNSANSSRRSCPPRAAAMLKPCSRCSTGRRVS